MQSRIYKLKNERWRVLSKFESENSARKCGI